MSFAKNYGTYDAATGTITPQTQKEFDDALTADIERALAATWTCLMCNASITQELYEETDGYCSYNCSSGGGFGAKKSEPTCTGCKEKQPNQMAHTGSGGCLSEPEKKPATLTWCPNALDNKHVNGPVRVVGQSWHGNVHAWNCVYCNYEFGHH